MALWQHNVNDLAMPARDIPLVRRYMEENGWTPVQIVLGLYQFRGDRFLTPKHFLDMPEEWLVEDELMAEARLALIVGEFNYMPEQALVYASTMEDGWDDADRRITHEKAARELRLWVDEWLERAVKL